MGRSVRIWGSLAGAGLAGYAGWVAAATRDVNAEPLRHAGRFGRQNNWRL